MWKDEVMKAKLQYWFKTYGDLLTNAGSLIGTSVVTSGMGFIYWWIVSLRFPKGVVGISTAIISAMMLLGTISTVGLGTFLIGELPRTTEKRASLIGASLLLASLMGTLAGILFALLVPSLSSHFHELRTSIMTVLLFATGVSLTACTLVLDQALLGLLCGTQQLLRNILFACIKLLALLPVELGLLHKSWASIYVTWIIGNVCSMMVLFLYWMIKGQHRHRMRIWSDWNWLKKPGKTAGQHYLFNLALQATPLLLPVLVTMSLSATTNAIFYSAWMIANFLTMIPLALTTILNARAAAHPESLTSNVRITLGLSVPLSGIAYGVLFVCAGFVMSLFGYRHNEQAVLCLQILGLSVFPATIRYHFVTIYRLRQRILHIVLPMFLCCIVELGAAALGARMGGLVGLSLGWLTVACTEACFMIRTVYQAMHHTSDDSSLDAIQEAVYTGRV
jgi:O-antigen/teichoic acid export membrane protein